MVLHMIKIDTHLSNHTKQKVHRVESLNHRQKLRVFINKIRPQPYKIAVQLR